MAKFIATFFLMLVAYAPVFSQTLAYVKNSSFDAGEVLRYKLKYGFITAAEATLQVFDSDVKFGGKPAYHLVALGRTYSAFDFFFKVRNRYESYIDKTNYTPFMYAEDIKEDSYRRVDKVKFNQAERKITGNEGTFTSPVSQTFDMVSAYYFARNLDLTGIKPGDQLTLTYFLKDAVTPLTIEYIGKEVIKTAKGKIRCLKFSPSISPGRIFKKNSQLFLWITDDENRIPVKAQAEVIVGNVTMEIADATGLKRPLQIVK